VRRTVLGLGSGLLLVALAGCARPAETSSGPAVRPVAVEAAAPVVLTTVTPSTQVPEPPPCDPGAVACVRLSTGQAWLRPPGQAVVGPVSIGYGVGRFATPTGVFHVSWKAEHYTSRTYHEPMPDAVFFAAGGVAFHAGSLDTNSHGCVHLAADVAAEFFATLQPGAEVQVLP
jgi:lipoprotein-anchoring transpeptidase ErfK/SrfK